MKKLILITMLVLIVLFTNSAYAQETSNKVIDLTWQTSNAEPDVQYYQIYAGDSDTTLVRFGELIHFNPNDPASPDSLMFDYEFIVPADSIVTKWFSVTAIDTSGNESNLAPPVSITVDSEPPSAPAGLTVTVRIVVQ